VGGGADRAPLPADAGGRVLERLIVDTSALIALERDASALVEAIGADDDVAVAAVTVAELLVGIELAAARYRDQRAAWVDGLLPTLVLEDYNLDVARQHASLLAHVKRVGEPRGAHDLIVAATARSRGRTVVTADIRGFSGLPEVPVRAVTI
jgi:tRNA(fMet)-specific endonuclease VapC